MYECPCKTIKSLNLIKQTTFGKNQFMTCYLIFNFRPTFFSYFWKITADSVFHNVKKQVGQKWPFPVVKGLNIPILVSKRRFVESKHSSLSKLCLLIFFEILGDTQKNWSLRDKFLRDMILRLSSPLIGGLSETCL